MPDHPATDATAADPAPLIAAAAATCARIEAADRDIRAFLAEPGRPARLAAEARELTRRWPDAAGRPPLYGVPVGVKDIFRVDGLPIAAGSILPAQALAGPEAEAVRRLRAAGAIVAGQTVTAEFAMFAPGPTRNPRNLQHTPGGSSAGSAAAVAAGLVPLALGTQTIASVIRPAAYCGIAGFRPTLGRVCADGVIPFAPSLDVVGCFAPDAAGLARAAAVLCDDWEPAGQATPALRLPALGIPVGRYLERASLPALAALAGQAGLLSDAGYQVREVPAMDDMAEIERQLIIITRYEAAAMHDRWFRQYGELYQAATAAVIRQGQAIEAGEYARALADRAELTRRLAGIAESAGIDAWLTPAATGPAPPGLASTGDPVMSMPWSLAGLPALALPAGLIAGLPVGAQFVAASGADEALLRWATGLESALAGLGRLDQRA